MNHEKKQLFHNIKLIINGSLLFIFLLSVSCLAETSSNPQKAAALISKNIKPYYEAMDGFASGLKKIKGSDTEIFEYEDFEKNQDSLAARMNSGEFTIVLAIGPEAARFILSDRVRVAQKIYIMITGLGDIGSDQAKHICGVSISVPVAEQIDGMKLTIKGIKRIGVLFDSSNNEEFVKRAENIAAKQSLSIVRLRVKNHHDISTALDKGLNDVDALWMIPDKTVISESLVPFIIKKSIASGVPVVGYNRYFLQNGAAMAFVINYRGIGLKASKIASESMDESSVCNWEAPDYEIITNQTILDMNKNKTGNVKTNAE